MGESAQVGSIEAIEEFRRELIRYAEHTSQALVDMQAEIRRAFDWLTHDQLKYWQGEIVRGSRALVEAKNELQLAQTSRKSDDYTPSCIQERKKIERMKQRLQLAESKVEAVRRWGRLLEREIDDFKTRASQLATMFEADVPKALAVLDRILRSLDAYVGVESGVRDSGSSLASARTGSVAVPDAEHSSGGDESSTQQTAPAEPLIREES